MIRGAIKKALYALFTIRVLNKSVICEATGQPFNIIDVLEESFELQEVPSISEEEKRVAANKLSQLTGMEQISTNDIVENFPTLALLFLIWARYGILNATLTSCLINFYAADSKEKAEQLAALYCWTYLEETINYTIPSKDRFIVAIIETQNENAIKLKIANKDYGWEFDTPKAMPKIVSEISEKIFGLN